MQVLCSGDTCGARVSPHEGHSVQRFEAGECAGKRGRSHNAVGF